MITSFSSFKVGKVTPQFLNGDMGSTMILPTKTYREKIENPLLNMGANYVVMYQTQNEMMLYMFYELVSSSLRLYVPSIIKTPELLIKEEKNIYVQMLEFIIRLHGPDRNRFFVFCPTKLQTQLARMLFAHVLERGFDRVSEYKSAGAFYMDPTSDPNKITWLQELDDWSVIEKRQAGLFLERFYEYDNGQTVYIIRITEQNRRVLKNWNDMEDAMLKIVHDVEQGTISNDGDLSDQVRKILEAKVRIAGESDTKKSRSLESRFNRAFVNILNATYSGDVLESYSLEKYDFMAYTMVNTVPDLIIVFNYGTIWDAALDQRVPVLHISYTVRMLQGMMVRLEEGTAYTEELPNLSNVFKSVLRFNKAEFGVDRLQIYHQTEGSTRMLVRDLTQQGKDAGLEGLRPADNNQIYPTNYFRMDLRICSGIGCFNLATHAFATDTQEIHAFCGPKCASNHHFQKTKTH